MTSKDPLFEIPDQVRNLADTSIDQTKKAFDEYLSKSRQTIADLEQQTEQAKSSVRGVQDEVLSHAEENVAAALDYARQIINAGSPADFMEIQRNFMEKQMGSLTKQAEGMSESAKATFTDMVEKVSGKK